MNERDFAFWLQGFFEISDAKTLDEKQVQIVKDHLKLVFEKKTPDYNQPSPTTGLPGPHTWTTIPWQPPYPMDTITTYCASTINGPISGSTTLLSALDYHIDPHIKCNLSC